MADAATATGRPTRESVLAEIVARATTLSERLATRPELAVTEHAERRLSRWSETVARGEPERFAVRLALDGLDPRSALAVVGDAPTAPGPLPAWARLVGDALAGFEGGATPDDRSFPPVGAPPVPLQDLTVPFVRVTRRRLLERIDPPGTAVGPEIVRTFEEELLRQLGTLLSPVADLEFRQWRRPRLDPFDEAIVRASGTPGDALYRAWVEELRAGGLAGLLREYAVVARLLGILALGWVEATAEFLERVVADAGLLAKRFLGGAPVGPLVAVGGASSDPHRGRRRVVGCTFESGLRLVYKPKNLRTEVVYGRILEWLNERGAAPSVRALAVLDRGDYGWVELAANDGVADVEAASRYYRRAGLLLALLYGIGAKDCHAENVVAAGEHPVVVDAETVLHPALVPPDAPDPDELDALHEAIDRYQSSVLGVGLLPDWMVGTDGRALDVSGLGAVDEQLGLEQVPAWEAPNTDAARLALTPFPVGPFRNVLRVDGEPQRPEEFADDVCAGFSAGYEILRRHRSELLSEDGPLEELRAAPVRVLFRPTQLYARAVLAAHVPRHLRYGVEYGIELDALGRVLLDGPDPARMWELHRLEQRDLDATDTPYLAAPGGAPGLLAGDGRLLVRFRASALETARARLTSLDEADERFQLALVRAALSTRLAPSGATAGDAEADPAAADPAAAAGRLATQLEETAIRAGAAAAWIGLTLADEAERWALRPTSYDLYEGTAGIALFLAAAGRVADHGFRSLAIAALRPALDLAARNPRRLAVLRGIGGSAGCGGIVYALALCAELLGDEQPLEAAQRLVRAVPAKAIEDDTALDLMAGAAGLLAGALALDRVAGGDTVAVELADACGRRLASQAVEIDDGTIAWRTLGGRVLDGVSHGTSGIALNLIRLAVRTDDDMLLDLALRALAGESGRFDAGHGGWPDRRFEDPPVVASWCHGAAGIGLARLGLLELPLPSEAHDLARRDLNRAAAAVLAGETVLDHLCCGRAGEIDFLVALAQATGDPAALARARELAGELAGRIEASAPLRFRTPDATAGISVCGLYQGVAGVGYALLRAAEPGLPSVLAWR